MLYVLKSMDQNVSSMDDQVKEKFLPLLMTLSLTTSTCTVISPLTSQIESDWYKVLITIGVLLFSIGIVILLNYEKIPLVTSPVINKLDYEYKKNIIVNCILIILMCLINIILNNKNIELSTLSYIICIIIVVILYILSLIYFRYGYLKRIDSPFQENEYNSSSSKEHNDQKCFHKIALFLFLFVLCSGFGISLIVLNIQKNQIITTFMTLIIILIFCILFIISTYIYSITTNNLIIIFICYLAFVLLITSMLLFVIFIEKIIEYFKTANILIYTIAGLLLLISILCLIYSIIWMVHHYKNHILIPNLNLNLPSISGRNANPIDKSSGGI